ncbi:MAG: flavodoxin family protein [Methanosarcinaceae archaeon]|nr:flavodoxin family protein [Methanosarcinaceae archaeon]
MRILGISGSPVAGGNNEKMINAALNVATKRGFDTESIFLSSTGIAPCNACEACGSGEKCSIRDDMDYVYPKLTDANAIIVSSPVYFGSVTAQLKALFDRSVLLRRQGFAMKNKVGAAMSIGGSRNGGQEKTIQTIHDWMHIHGMIVVGDGSHFGGIVQKPMDTDDEGMQTVRDMIGNLCDVLDLMR